MDYVVTSPTDATYNCIAYAARDTTKWWEALEFPEPGYFWPAEALGDENGSIEALKRCFLALRYEECNDGELETGYEKVAPYAIKKDDYTHAAVQEKDGQWTSKLGDGFDIRHRTAQCVCGPKYGNIMAFMRRKTVGP